LLGKSSNFDNEEISTNETRSKAAFLKQPDAIQTLNNTNYEFCWTHGSHGPSYQQHNADAEISILGSAETRDDCTLFQVGPDMFGFLLGSQRCWLL
jgi:hypothetical protein